MAGLFRGEGERGKEAWDSSSYKRGQHMHPINSLPLWNSLCLMALSHTSPAPGANSFKIQCTTVRRLQLAWDPLLESNCELIC